MSFYFRCDALDRLKQKCSTLEQEIRDPVRFKDFYQFTFNYAKNPGQKGLGETFVKLALTLKNDKCGVYFVNICLCRLMLQNL